MTDRSETALEIARSGGTLAIDQFQRVSSLQIVDKGLLDVVSEADRTNELHIGSLIEAAYPEDGSVGEEHAPGPGTS